MQNPKLTIRQLPTTKKAQNDSKLPLKKIQRTHFALDQDKKLQNIGSIYGSAMAMMMKHQRKILSQPQRLPGLRSSFLSLQSHLGRLDKIDFQDVLNRDSNIQKFNAHDVYLRQFA